jgi:hypothetical protein
MEKREFEIINNSEVFSLTFLGFKERTGYGEIFITESRAVTYIFRGFNRKEVLRGAKVKVFNKLSPDKLEGEQ